MQEYINVKRNRIEKEREIVSRHGFFFLNEVHNKILMEEYRYDGIDFTKK